MHDRHVEKSKDLLRFKMAVKSQKRAVGFDCEFVDPPPVIFQSECPICLLIIREPYQVTCCGKKFCLSCIQLVQTSKKPCPTCKSEQISIFPDKGLKQTLYGFKVRCSHQKDKDGCKWTGELGQLDGHLNTDPQPEKQLNRCQFVEICCIYNCGDKFQRRYIQTHQTEHCTKRPFSCEHCHNYESNFDDVILSHWPVCGSFLLHCPNQCGLKVQRQNVGSHVADECPLTTINCDFLHVGCSVKLPRKVMPEHLRENLLTHISLLATSHSKIATGYAKLERAYAKVASNHAELQEQHNKLSTSHKGLVASHTTLGNVHDKLVDKHTTLCKSHEELCCKYETLAKKHERLASEHTALGNEQKRLVAKNISLSDSYFDLLCQHEQLKEDCHKLKSQVERLESSLQQSAPTKPKDAQIITLHRSSSTAVPNRLHLAKPLPAPQSPQRTEPIRISESAVLVMKSFEQQKRDDRSTWFSPPIYTHYQGYKLCLGVHANGWSGGEGTHISVAIYFMRGEFDDFLSWPFYGSISVQLLDQRGSHHLTKEAIYDRTVNLQYRQRVIHTERAPKGWVFIKFIAHGQLKPNYLQHNSLQFRIAGGKALL